MKPSRCPAGPLHRRSAAVVFLVVFFVTGCSGIFRSAPAPSALPTGAGLKEDAAADRAWWKARFRFPWPEGETPRWYMDLLIADRLVKPVLIEHRQEVALWRLHRRAGRDGAGHQFTFLFFADREAARRILAELRQAPLPESLQRAAMLDSVLFDDPDGNPDNALGAASDPAWSAELRTAWPYYIMGVSAMWLELIHQISGSASPSDDSPEVLVRHYREVDQRLNRIWEDEAQHALLHHLSAVFGYRPMMIQKRMRF